MRLGSARAGPFFFAAAAPPPKKNKNGRKEPGRHDIDLLDQAQRSAATFAPSMAPGASLVPLWTTTATVSISPAPISRTGSVKVCAVPFQSPSLIQRRTTL